MEVSERRKSTTEDKLQNKNISVQNHNKDEPQKLNGESKKPLEKKISVDNTETVKLTKEEKTSSPEKLKNVDMRPKSAESKKNSGSKKQMSVEEKRKSAPVRPESSEEWKKPAFNKQSSLEEKNRYLIYILLIY